MAGLRQARARACQPRFYTAVCQVNEQYRREAGVQYDLMVGSTASACKTTLATGSHKNALSTFRVTSSQLPRNQTPHKLSAAPH